MRINMHFLLDECEQIQLKGTMVDSPKVARCERPILCESLPAQLGPSVIYVIGSKDLPASRQVLRKARRTRKAPDEPPACRPSILCGGEPPAAWLAADANVLYSQTASVTELANAVIGVFASYARWEERLQAAVDEGLGIAEVARRSVEVFGNPIFAQSSSFQVLFCELPEPAEKDARLQAYLDDNYLLSPEGEVLALSDNVLTAMSTDPEYQQATDAVDPAIYSGGPFGFRSLYYNCRMAGSPVARVTVEEVVRPLRNRDYVLIEALGKFPVKAGSGETLKAFDLPQDYDMVVRSLIGHDLIPESNSLEVW